jgi:hypothetical protein
MSNNGMDWAFCIMKDDDAYYYIYYVKPYAGVGRKVYRMRSNDGKTNWKDDPASAVLGGKAGTKYDGGTTCPTVWKESGCYHMIFSGECSKDRKYRAFYATSKDGVSWIVQNDDKPIINTGGRFQWDNMNAEPTGLIKVGSIYYCWYNNIDCRSAANRQMGLATSTDLLHWTKDPKNPIFGAKGSRPSDFGIFCPSPMKYNNKYYLFACHFVENCAHSVINLYKCDKPTFYPADRTLVQVVKKPVAGSQWEAEVLDPAYVLTDDINRDTFSASDYALWMYYGASTGSTRGIGLCTEPLKVIQPP